MEEQQEPVINKVISSSTDTPPSHKHKIIKYIAMGVFVLLPFVGFYLGMEYGKQIEVNNVVVELQLDSNRMEMPTSTPDTKQVNVVEDISCPRWPISMQKSMRVFEYFEVLHREPENKELESFLYTPYWIWCQGSRGLRVLPDEYIDHIEKVGEAQLFGINDYSDRSESNKNRELYILKSTAPFLSEDSSFYSEHFIPSEKDNSGAFNYFSDTSEWEQFLADQKNDYPILIKQDDNGQYLMFFRIDYLPLPGC